MKVCYVALLLSIVVSGSDAFHSPRFLEGVRVPIESSRIGRSSRPSRPSSRSNPLFAVVATPSSTERSHTIVPNADDLAESIGTWEYQHEYHPVRERYATSMIEATGDSSDGSDLMSNEEIARPTLRLVHRMARSMARGQSELEDDLVQEGIIALMEAIQHYPLLSHKVMPLDQYVKRHVIAEMTKSMEGCLLFHEQRPKRQRPLDSQSTMAPIEKRMSTSIRGGQFMISSSDSTSWSWLSSNSLVDLDELTPENQALQSMIRSHVSTACDEVLNDMECQAIRLHFGLDQPDAALSWREMAKRWKTTPQFVQSITLQALRKLRRHSVGDEWRRSL